MDHSSPSPDHFQHDKDHYQQILERIPPPEELENQIASLVSQAIKKHVTEEGELSLSSVL
jgi:hypothetical protein